VHEWSDMQESLTTEFKVLHLTVHETIHGSSALIRYPDTLYQRHGEVLNSSM
jgi:hypothetical protein